MRIWVDLANSPHVAICDPIVRALEARGDEVLITVREHAQTAELALERWPEATVVGGESPAGLRAKGGAILGRAAELARIGRAWRPDVAFSHGSYALVVAARRIRVPAVTMMDYEYQPANHLSFRLSRRVIVPEAFPAEALRRFGARSSRVRRYAGFKEELYLAGFRPDRDVLVKLGLDTTRAIAVVRLGPDGALYHRGRNARVDDVLDAALSAEAQVVLLPRTREHRQRYATAAGVTVPERAIDGRSLVALADVTVGAGGTMTRESALLGTRTYTIFEGRPPAVDRELMRQGRLHDLTGEAPLPSFRRRLEPHADIATARRDEILDVVVGALDDAAASRARARFSDISESSTARE